MASVRRVRAAVLVAVAFWVVGGPALAQGPAVGQYQKVSEARVTRDVTLFTYRATLTNNGTAIAGATAVATSTSPHTVIVDGTLTFGAVGAGGAVISTDTFSFRHDRRVPFDWANIQWQVTPLTANQPPVADAGPDQQVAGIGILVPLDGTASSDPDGDPLTFAWQLQSVPPGSTAALTGATTSAPSLTPDVKGTYVAQLIVNDGTADSAADTVAIEVGNTAPVADAGGDFTRRVTETAELDGGGSSDADGDPLTYAWTLVTRPTGSTASLDSSTSQTPSFLVDKPGTYVVQLIVNDGEDDSAADTITITTENTPPIANAGPDQTAIVGGLVTLNGSGSSDVDGDALSFFWSFQTVPAGSGAVLDNPSTATPTFTLDVAGIYEVALIVNDGFTSSTVDTVLVSTQNSAPVADAGADQSVFVEQTVTLDGSASTDVDGNALTYLWSMVSLPAGSAATLSAPTSVQPTFVPDVPGAYTIQLIVNDGFVNSAPDTVVITTQNSAPIADAGPNQSAPVGASVTLDGSGSSDVDGDVLTYSWSLITTPAGSTAALSDPAAIMPTLLIDQPGTYIAQLIVHDGTVMSAADTVTITTDNSPPIAEAGSDQTVVAGQVVSLDGSASSDADLNALTYLWSFVSQPAGSGATLSDPTGVTTTFVADLPGVYVVQLIVNDGLVNSAPDTVTITTTNSVPVADAGPDQLNALVGSAVTLDGAGSTDADGHVLTYQWALIGRPAGSTATMNSSTTVAPTFTPDVFGDYIAQLIVNDGFVSSAPDTVLIRTANRAPQADAGIDQTVTLGALVQLDASGSSDPDGQPLTYAWTFASTPTGSTAALSDAASPAPTFTPDLSGAYILDLTVSDGITTATDQVIITVDVTQGTLQVAPGSLAFPNTQVGASSVPLAVTVTNNSGALVAISNVTISGPFAVVSNSCASLPSGGACQVQVVFEPSASGAAAGTLTIESDATGSPHTVPLSGTGQVPGLSVSTTALTFATTVGQTSTPLNVVLTNTGVGPNDVSLAISGDFDFTTTCPATLVAGTSCSVSVTFSPATAGTLNGSLTITSDAPGSPQIVTLTGDAIFGALTLNVPGNAPIGVGRTVLATVTLAGPAPAGGTAVTLTSDVPTIASIEAPATITIPEGQISGQVSVSGEAPGATTIRATATGYSAAALNVTVTLNLISTPSTLDVALGQTTALPVSIGPTVAPAGGIVIDLVSSDPATIEVITPQVTVPAGALSVNATVRGAGVGTATVSASNPSFSPSSTVVTSSGVLNITVSSVSFNNGFTPPNVTVRLESNGSPVPAPANLVVSLASAATGCVTVPASTTILAGQVSATFQPSYGGTATLPCTAIVTASANGLTSDTVSVTVNPQPIVNFIGNVTLGAGLQLHTGGSLSLVQHGGVTVTVTSSDPTKVLVAPDGTTAGAASISFDLSNGQNGFSYVLQAIENVTGAATVTVAATGFVSQTYTATVVPTGVEIHSLPLNTTSLSADAVSWYAQVGPANALGTGLLSIQNVRAGSPGFVLTFTNSNAAVAQLRSDEPVATGQVVTKPIQPNIYYTQAIAAGTSYGLAFDPLGDGTTTVTVTGPAGVVTLPQGIRTVTVSGAGINVPGGQTVGAGLQLQTGGSLGASQHGGVTVTVASSDASKVLVSPDATTVGSASFTINLANGVTNISYVMQALENTTGTATVTLSAPGFTSNSHTVQVVPTGVEIHGLELTTTTLSVDDVNWYAQIGPANTAGTGLLTVQNVRAGSPGFVVTFTNDNAAVAQLRSDEPATTGQTVSKPIQPGIYYTQAVTGGTVYGLAFDPIGAGSTTITATGPAGVVTLTNGVRTVTVSGPSINAGGTARLGSGLQLSQFASLGASQHGGVTVTIESSDPTRVLVSPDATTAGSASITRNVANGQTSISYYIQGVENMTGTATITLSAPSFGTATHGVDLVPAGVEIYGLPPSMTNLSADANAVYVQVGAVNATTNGLSSVQNVRAGSPGFVVTLTNSNPTVAQLRSDEPAAVGQVVSKPIQPNIYYTVAVAAGTSWGLAFDPLSNGTTTVTATGPTGVVTLPAGVRTVIVDTPEITVTPSVTVGTGLQQSVSAALEGAQHGGVDVTITSSAPSLVLVSPNGTTAGTSSIVVTVPNGVTHLPFVIQALENVGGTSVVTLSAPGFLNATVTVTVTAAGVEIHGLPTTIAAAAADATQMYVQTGLPNSNNTGLNQVQNVRAGSPGFVVTLTNSNAAVAQLKSDEPPTTGQSVTKPINANIYYTVAATSGSLYGLSFDPLAAGTTSVTVTGPAGVLTMSTGTRTVTVTP